MKAPIPWNEPEHMLPIQIAIEFFSQNLIWFWHSYGRVSEDKRFLEKQIDRRADFPNVMSECPAKLLQAKQRSISAEHTEAVQHKKSTETAPL